MSVRGGGGGGVTGPSVAVVVSVPVAERLEEPVAEDVTRNK